MAPVWMSASDSVRPAVRKLVAAKPPSGSATTELSVSGSGATAQPTHVSSGGFALPSTSNTSTDSRKPWCTR